MSCKESTTFSYNIDSLVVDESTIRGWGWVYDILDICSIVLIIRNKNEELELPTNVTYTRVDVQQKLSHRGKAAGFWFINPLPFKPERVFLSVTYANGTSRRVEITDLVKQNKSCSSLIFLVSDLNKVVLYLKQRRFGLLIKAAFRRTYTAIARLISSLKCQFNNLDQINVHTSHVIIDHDLGGGANYYTEQLLKLLKETGKTAAVIRYNFLNSQYSLTIASTKKTTGFNIKCLDTNLFDRFKELSIVILNNIVSFEEPLLVLKLLEDVKVKRGCKLIFVLHDYFCICPSYALIDSNGKYCGLPDSYEKCEACISNHRGNVALFFYKGLPNIRIWREAWGRFLSVVDEVICFSSKSASILLKVYPQISEKIVMAVHEVPAFPRKPRISFEKGLHIGIVGHISEEKGAKLVYDIASLISRNALPIKITVLGTLEARYHHPIIQITGPYRREALPQLIEKSGTNIFFLPSVCPETYNLVADELMCLDLPLAVLNVNVAAERVEKYHKGIVIKENEPEKILKRLIDFFEAQKAMQESRNASCIYFSGLKLPSKGKSPC